MTTFAITIKYDLKTLRVIYRHVFGTPKDEKITKQDIASWLGNLAESDVESEEGYALGLNDNDEQ